MITTTKYPETQLHRRKLCNLCRLEDSALSVDSMRQVYVGSWFNLPITKGEPG